MRAKPLQAHPIIYRVLSRFAFKDWEAPRGGLGIELSYKADVIAHIWTEWRELDGDSVQAVQYGLIKGDTSPEGTIADSIAALFALVCRWAVRNPQYSDVFDGLPIPSVDDPLPRPPLPDVGYISSPVALE